MAINLNDTTPAAPSGGVNVKWQSDGSNNASAYMPLSGIPGVIGCTIDGGGSVITAGQKGYVSVPYGCTITGWDIIADQSGSITVEIDKHAGAVPNTTTDKISASAPPALSSAQIAQNQPCTGWSASGAVAAGDVIGFNVSGTPVSVTRVTVLLRVTRT